MINKSILENTNVRRFLAFYIDALIITFLAFIFLYFFDKKGPTIECEKIICWNPVRIVIFQLLFYFIYFTFMEFYFFYTIGKKIFGFNISNKKNKFLNVVLRTLIRLIPINLISFLFDRCNFFWHEKWTNIYTQKTKPIWTISRSKIL